MRDEPAPNHQDVLLQAIHQDQSALKAIMDCLWLYRLYLADQGDVRQLLARHISPPDYTL